MSTQTQSISLHELSASNAHAERVADATQDDRSGDDDARTLTSTSDSRQSEASRKRALILLGASISQLPIWGKSSNLSFVTYLH